MIKKLRYMAYALAFAALPATSFAEDPAPADLSSVGAQIKTGIEGMVPTILTVVGGIIVACLAFWGLSALVKFARRYFGGR